MKRVLSLLIIVLCATSASAYTDRSVIIKNTDGIHIDGAPTTTGVPFAKGELVSSNNIQLFDSTSTITPHRATITSRWQDGSAKWVLIDTQLQGGSESYTIRYGVDVTNATTVPNPVSITSDENYYKISTGATIAYFKKEGFNIFDRVYIDKDNSGTVTETIADRIVDSGSQGIKITSETVDYMASQSGYSPVFEIEDANDLHATLKVTGEHRSPTSKLFDYTIRIHAYAGKSYFRVVYTYTERDLPVVTDSVIVSEIETTTVMTIGSGDYDVNISGDPSNHTGVITGGTFAKIYQAGDNFQSAPVGSDADTIDYSISGVITATGGHSKGWVDTSNTACGVTVAIKNFWQLYPKAISTTKSGDNANIKVALWPTDFEDQTVYAGFQKTNEIMYNFHTGGWDAANESVVDAFQRPMYIICSPDVYTSSQVLGKLPVKDISVFKEEFRTAVQDYYDKFADRWNRIKIARFAGGSWGNGHEYGSWGFGDGRGGLWSNMHWGAPHALFIEFMRTIDMEFLQYTLDQNEHYRDIDILHSDADHGRNKYGGTWIGKPRYNPNNYRHNLGYNHTYNAEAIGGQSLAEHYLFTGDRLSLEMLGECYSYVNGVWRGLDDAGFSFDYGSRIVSKPLNTCMAYYEATGTDDSKAKSLHWYTRLSQWQDQTDPTYDAQGRGWIGEEASDITSSFMNGYSLESMMRYGDIFEDDAAYQRLLKGSQWLVSAEAQLWNVTYFMSWVGVDYGQTSSPGDLMSSAALGKAWNMSGDTNLRDIGLQAIATGITNTSTTGLKVVGQENRSTPYFLYYLQENIPTQPSISITTLNQTVPNTTTSIEIVGTTQNSISVTCDPTATNTGTVATFTFENVPLTVGPNVITVTASDGSTDATDNVTITRESEPQPTTGTSLKGATLKGVTIP